MKYDEFLKGKAQAGSSSGFKPLFMPDYLFDFQEHLVDWSLWKGKSALFADTGMGKEQPYSEPILTPMGFIEMGKLKVGDNVVGKDGKKTKILNIYEQGEKDVYKIIFNDGTTTRCGFEHLWNVKDRNDRARKKDYKILKLNEIIKDYKKNVYDKRYPEKKYYDYKYSIPINNAVEFESKKKFTLHPYLVGLLIGDGGLSQKGVNITTTKKNILKSIKELIPKDDKIGKRKGITHSIVNAIVSNQPSMTKKLLIDLGLHGKLSKEKFIPENYLYLSIENRKQLLKGLLDTDGHIITSGINEYSTSSKFLMKDISFLARSLGYLVRVKKRKSCYTKNGVRSKSFVNYRIYMYNNKARKLKTIVDIKKIGREKSRCIYVDNKSNLYLTNNFIVTHNTVMQLVWAMNVVEKTNKNVLILTPLSVSYQTIKEGLKFDIEVNRSRDGKSKGKITVTNYQQLSKFDKNDYIAVVLDECFVKNTPIDVLSLDNNIKQIDIENIRKGDKIINAYGVDNVKEVYKRKINRAIQVNIGGRKITCSENHPFFTLHGWKCAQDLQPDDRIMATRTAMCMVWEDFSPEVCSTKKTKILRDILCSEMENETTRNIKKNSYKGSSSKNWEKNFCMVKQWGSRSNKTNRKNKKIESNVKPRNKKESIINIAENEAQASNAWGKWSRNDIASAINEGCIVRKLDSGICYITWKTSNRFSDMLQSRLRESRKKNSNRNRRTFPSFKEGKRYKENKEIEFFRVESVEVLELGDPRLDEFRDEEGQLYFYDIKAERHPSFSVNGCLVHNSSILKNFAGHFKTEITRFMNKMPYRLLCTATPSPNDFVELGTSSEALGSLKYMDMIDQFFRDTSNDKNPQWSTPKYVLKGHAVDDFWRWVSSWAKAIKKPSDLGYSDDRFILPELVTKEHILECTEPLPGNLFVTKAKTLTDQRAERKMTIEHRVEKVAELCEGHKISIIWGHYNYETDCIEKAIPDCIQISGRDSDEEKEEKYIAFSKGQIKNLVIKPKMGAFGFNWQHCNHMTFFPSHSFEQFYQGVRRCWRFGQKKKVFVDWVTTEGESGVLANINRKARDAEKMYEKMVQHMNNELNIEQVNQKVEQINLPAWL